MFHVDIIGNWMQNDGTFTVICEGEDEQGIGAVLPETTYFFAQAVAQYNRGLINGSELRDALGVFLMKSYPQPPAQSCLDCDTCATGCEQLAMADGG